jgi:hypothetical protein
MEKSPRSMLASRPTSVPAALKRIGMLCLLTAPLAWSMPARADTAPYASMAPLEQYLMADKAAEIALAKSAAPKSVSDDATVLVLGKSGFETAVKGTNGFVCYVARSWDNDFNNAEFWNPKVRGPICANAATARSVLPSMLQRTQWAVSGLSKDEILARTKAAIAAKQITAPEPGSMSFMLSKGGYLGDQAGGPWHPHIMFWGPPGPGSNWGADLDGSQIFSDAADVLPYTMYFIPVRRWSDGSLAEYPQPAGMQHHSH